MAVHVLITACDTVTGEVDVFSVRFPSNTQYVTQVADWVRSSLDCAVVADEVRPGSPDDQPRQRRSPFR
jgi:hypothetical protein